MFYHWTFRTHTVFHSILYTILVLRTSHFSRGARINYFALLDLNCLVWSKVEFMMKILINSMRAFNENENLLLWTSSGVFFSSWEKEENAYKLNRKGKPSNMAFSFFQMEEKSHFVWKHEGRKRQRYKLFDIFIEFVTYWNKFSLFYCISTAFLWTGERKKRGI